MRSIRTLGNAGNRSYDSTNLTKLEGCRLSSCNRFLVSLWRNCSRSWCAACREPRSPDTHRSGKRCCRDQPVRSRQADTRTASRRFRRSLPRRADVRALDCGNESRNQLRQRLQGGVGPGVLVGAEEAGLAPLRRQGHQSRRCTACAGACGLPMIKRPPC